MKRLARRMFTLCSAVSLMACVAVCVLWARSYWVEDSLDSTHEKGLWMVEVSLGIMCLYHERIVDPNASYTEDEFNPYGLRFESDPKPTGPTPAPMTPNGRDVDLRLGSLRIGRHDGTGSPWGSIIWYVTVPCWLVASMLALAPSGWAWRHARNRPRPGHCRRCGYDLRASPDRCPECGIAPRGPQ